MSTKYNILVVDDDLKNIQVGINFLKQNHDYRLVFATSGEQALQRVGETDFDLILLDIVMPVMDGYEVCTQLKNSERTKDIPVIFLTAKHGEESIVKGFEAGGADYITKPFNAAELNARVKTHLELHYYYRTEIAKLQKLLMYSQKAETIKFIAGGVAHDCKNFLTTIPYYLQELSNKVEKREFNEQEWLELIGDTQTSVDKVNGLIEQFFSFSKDESIQSEIVDMNEVVSDLSKIYKDWIRHNIDFTIELLSQPAVTIADKLHVEQVLLNLLINAQHAILEKESPFDQPRIQLIIDRDDRVMIDGLSKDKVYITITVRDNGIGMTEDLAQKIFDPHFTTRKNHGGSGLGLSVSNHIIQLHKGAIEVESAKGAGATFKVYLPMVEDS